MTSFKLPMRKYFTLLYVTFSVMCFAQYTDNVFDKSQTATTTQQPSTMSGVSTAEPNQSEYDPTEAEQSSSSVGVPGPGDQEEGPGNPGEPVPINDYIPYLLILGVFLMIYYQIKNKKVNI